MGGHAGVIHGKSHGRPCWGDTRETRMGGHAGVIHGKSHGRPCWGDTRGCFLGSSSLLVGTKIMYCIDIHNDYCCVYIHRCLKIRDNTPSPVFVQWLLAL